MMMSLKAHFLVFSLLFCASGAQAMTASEVFEKVSPSVVVITTYDVMGVGQNLGSGVVLEDGVVATNCHVVKEAATIQVARQEKKYLAALRHSDWDRDICTLFVDGLKGHAATMGSTSRLKVGEKVYAVGAPKGLELTLSDGIISSLRPVPGGQYLQITAPISPGSSGGGLFDNEGRLIGLPTFYITQGQQLNFAVPVEWINALPKRSSPIAEFEKTVSTEWLNRSIELHDKKAWSGLLEHVLRWTKAQPEVTLAWYNLGLAYGYLGKSELAVEAYQKAIRLSPEEAHNWIGLGVIYEESNHFSKAIEAYQEAVRLNPQRADAWSNMGNAYVALNIFDKAIVAHQQAVRLRPEDARAWNNLGVAYWHTRQADMLMEVYKRLKVLDSTMADQFYKKVFQP